MIGSAAARLWRNLLRLEPSTPGKGSLLDGILEKSTADDELQEANMNERIRDRIAPFSGIKKPIFEMLSELGTYWGHSMIVDGRVNENMPWADVFREMGDKLKMTFGEQLVRVVPESRPQDAESE